MNRRRAHRERGVALIGEASPIRQDKRSHPARRLGQGSAAAKQHQDEREQEVGPYRRARRVCMAG